MGLTPVVRNIWRVAAHEYRVNIRRAGFLFSAFGIPLFTIGLMVFITVVLSDSFTDQITFERIAVADDAGVIKNHQWRIFTLYANEAEAERAYETGEVDGLLKLPEDYLARGTAELITDAALTEILRSEITIYLRNQLLHGLSGLSDAERMRVNYPGRIDLQILNSAGEPEEAAPAFFLRIPVAIAFGMIWMFIIQITASYMMTSVAEEKSNRILEILITSMTAGQLLRGKLLGLIALGFTQVLIWGLVGAVFFLFSGQSIPLLADLPIPLDMLLLTTIFFGMLFALNAVVSISIGAIVGSPAESRQQAGILSIISWLPLMLFSVIIQNPDSIISQILTFIPFTAPMMVTVRWALGSLSTLSVVVSGVILFLSTVFSLWMGERLFRWSLLRYGKQSSIRALVQSLRERSPGLSA